MSEHKSIFVRAYDAVIESRMRHAEAEVKRYKALYADELRAKDL